MCYFQGPVCGRSEIRAFQFSGSCQIAGSRQNGGVEGEGQIEEVVYLYLQVVYLPGFMRALRARVSAFFHGEVRE